MRKILFGLTTALALGALALPTVAYAALHGGVGGGHFGGGGGGGGMHAGGFSGGGMHAGGFGGGSFNAAPGFSGNRAFASPNMGSRNFSAGNLSGRNFTARNNSTGRNVVTAPSTRNFARADNGRHFRHHRGRGFIGGFGGYAAYDYCWNRVWTPYGYERVYVCGPYPYDYN